VIGLFALAGWLLIGALVAAIEKSRNRPDDLVASEVTLACLAGAIIGGYATQALGLSVFGEPLGFVAAAAGAEALLHLTRTRNVGAVPRTVNDRPFDQLSRPPELMPTPSAAQAPSAQSPGLRVVEAVGWGGLAAIGSAVAGLIAHVIGGRIYPQRYEQIPSDLVFVPLGLVFGFVCAFTVRLVRPRCTVTQMFAAVAVVAGVYAALMFQHAESNAQPPLLVVSLEPESLSAAPCTPVACPPANPPMEWMGQGAVRIREASGLSGAIDDITVTSYSVPANAKSLTREESIALRRFVGPAVHLSTAAGAAGRMKRAETVSFPVRYAYRTLDGRARRNVLIEVSFTDDRGRRLTGRRMWDVR